MRHFQDTKPKTQAYTYQPKRKVTAPRPPEESTLFKGIHNVKKLKDEAEAPTFKPQTRPYKPPKKKEEVKQQINQRQKIIEMEQQRAEEEQRARDEKFAQRHHQEELEDMKQQHEAYDQEVQESPEQPQEEGEDGTPLLFVDVNLGPGKSERIVVYEGDTAEQLADDFTQKHGLDEALKQKLIVLLEDQIAGLLARIDEEMTSNYSENQEGDETPQIHDENENDLEDEGEMQSPDDQE